MVTRPLGQPRADVGVFVSGVVVNDQVHIEVGRNLCVDVAQKAQKLLVPMARLALGDDAAVGHVERRKQGRGAVPIVVVGDAFDIAEPHRQHRLTALEGLNLALLVDAQNQRVFSGFKYNPTASRTFSTKNGSVESLKDFVRALVLCADDSLIRHGRRNRSCFELCKLQGDLLWEPLNSTNMLRAPRNSTAKSQPDSFPVLVPR
jgi:hypothetical protein